MKKSLTYVCLLLLVIGCKKDSTITPPVDTPPVVVDNTPPITLTAEVKNNSKIFTDITLTQEGDILKGYTTGPASISRQLVLTFKLKDAASVVKVKDVVQASGVTLNDFTKPVVYTVTDSKGASKDYTVGIYNFTGLPIFNITTAAPVVSKVDYVAGSININTNGLYDQETNDIKLQIKGRGNSTWGMPKKPYRLKFDSKAKVLGLASAKNWVLLANYTDKTLMRNYIADGIAQSLSSDFAPHGIFVEVVMNGEYQGTYMLTEQVEVNAARVNITELKPADNGASVITGGYLLELDQRKQDPYLFATNGGIPFTIKSPDVPSDAQTAYIKGYIQDTESAIFAANFADLVNGYAKYINSDSFINWFLVNELFKNQDAANFSSMYYYKDRGGKLGMGPAWDFDLGAGNVDYSDATKPEGWWVKDGPWFKRLFQDPAFLTKVRTRWQFLKANGIPAMYKSIDDSQAYLTLPAQENFTKWDILNKYVWPNPVVLGTYPREVAQLKYWLTQRVAWIDSNL
ncbi:CotH kinase family protein [Mucilaginibacter sp. RB4R14]|uniref:CotH kinase family protein n=1 Tax=Mucilaginibacter aurantiaciroseus TaxID=2949308 RepID=UPI0020913083|nr:CotH kinase family protein [Mucilaginibacter aurantiaciroseus]MCO5937187.1 CotH kinase family protein [Mucilaginibacter aurantiaciroseus]